MDESLSEERKALKLSTCFVQRLRPCKTCNGEYKGFDEGYNCGDCYRGVQVETVSLVEALTHDRDSQEMIQYLSI